MAKFTKLRQDATGALSATATFNPSTGVFTATANITTDGYVTTEDTASETYTLTPKTSDALTTSGRTVTVPAGYYPDGASKAISSSYVIPSGTKEITSSGTTNVSGYANATVAAGSVSVTGGALTAGDGAVSAIGTNVTLTELDVPPDSGSYITVTGSGSVTREAVIETRGAGYISAQLETNILNSSSKSSNTATKYYAITTENTVYLYGVYQFIATPTMNLSTSQDWTLTEEFTFGWTNGTTGDAGISLDVTHSSLTANYLASGNAFWITYDDQVAYSDSTYSNIGVSYTGWQALDGVGTNCRTIIIPNPVPISTTSDFYQWFSSNAEKVGDWEGGGSTGGSTTTTVSTCSLVTSGYPTSGRLFYTDAASCTQTMDINPGSAITTIACGKIYVMGMVSDVVVTSGGNTYPGTLVTSMSSGDYLYEIEIPASLAGMEVVISY